MEPGGGALALRGPPRGRGSETDNGLLVPRGPVSEDVLAAINERATAIFSSHKHRASGMLEPQQGPYALALVGAMLGLNQKQLDSELQLTTRVGRRSLSYEEFMSACEAMVALHGAVAQQQIKRLPNNDMSSALRAAFNLYVKLNVGGFVGGDQRMNSNQFVKMCQDAGLMEPNGPASMATLQISWASCKATFGSTRLQYNQFLKVMGALAAELSGDVFLLVAGLGLQLPTVPPLRNGFRKPDAGEVNVPKPEVVQGMGAHMAAEEAYEKYVQEGRMPDKRDPLGRANASPIKGRSSVNGGGVPNWVKAMQADQGGVGPMTSGQDIRGIPIIETPDSDDEAPRKPQRKSVTPVPLEEPTARAKASPMRPRGKLPAMGGADPGSPSLADPELVIRSEAPNYGGPGARTEILSAPVAVRPRDSVRNGVTMDPDSPPGPLEPSILPAPPRMRKSVVAPEGFREVVEQQAAAVKALEGRVAEQQQRETELFERVQILTEKLADAQAAVTVQTGCPGAPLPDMPHGKGRTVMSGRCPLTDQVEKLTEQMAEVLARLSALESIRMQPKAPPSEPPAKQRNPIGARTPEFPDEPQAVMPVGAPWAPPGAGRSPRGAEPGAVTVISPLEPANWTQGEWMSRLLLNLDKRVRVLEGAAGKEADTDGEALAEVLKQLRNMQPAGSPAPPAPPAPGSSPSPPPDPAFLKVDPKRKMEKVADGVDLAPALMPTGDPELDRRLAALANDLRSKHATVGLLLDMLNQTRGEVASLAAQLAELRNGGAAGGPVVVGQRPAGAAGGPQRNAIRVVDGGLVPPEGAGGLAPPVRRVGEAAAVGDVAPLEPQLEGIMAEQHGLKRAVRELCAAVGLPPPPAVAAVAAPEASPRAVTLVSQTEASAEAAPWGQPGRKTLKEETQEVKRNVEGVQADVGELKKQVELIRAVAGYGEWPTPLRPEGAAPAMAVVPGAAPMQAVSERGRNPLQVMVGAPTLANDPMGLAPIRKPMHPGGDMTIPPLPSPEIDALKSELRRLQAFVGMPEAQPAAQAAAAGAAVVALGAAPAVAAAGAEAGKWADAGKGPQPLKDAVGTVASEVEALRKHVKAMDAALRTNIGNTNNLTTFINDHAPALVQAAQQAKEGGAGGRNPIMVTPGELQQQGMQPPPKRGVLPLQTEGNYEAGVVDPTEYQQLRDQVHTMARFLGVPAGGAAAQGSPAPPAPQPPGSAIVSVTSPEASAQTWGMPGRGGRGGSVAEGLGQVSSEVEGLKKQVTQMGYAMQAAGLPVPAVDGAPAALNGGPEAVGMVQRQQNPIVVTPGAGGVDGSMGLNAPLRKGVFGPEGVASLEGEVGALKDDVRAMRQFLGLEEAGAPIRGVVVASGGGAAAGAESEQGPAGTEPWGDKGRGTVFTREPFDVDKAKKNVTFGNLGEMARDIDVVKRKQAELEEAVLRMGGQPLPIGEQGGSAVRVVGAAGAAQRNAVSVSPGLVQQPDAVGFSAPKRPLQPLSTIEGVPEPVLNHLGALQDDVRRVTAFLDMKSVAAGTGPPSPAPGQAARQTGAAPPAAAQQPWGAAPPRREGGSVEQAVKVERLSDLVKEVEESKARQQGVERVLMAMGAQIPWANEPQPQQTPVATAGQAAPQEVAAQRQRNPIHVTAVGLQEGATGFAPPGRKPLEPMAGTPEAASPVVAQLADDLKRVQAFLGMGPAVAVTGPAAAGPDAPKALTAAPGEARSGAVEPWGAPGHEPRQPGQELRSLGEVVRDVDHDRRRIAALEEAMRSAGIPFPPPEPPTRAAQMPDAVAVAGLPERQAQRQRNPVSVIAGSLQDGAVGFAPPARPLLPALSGLPEPAQAELLCVAEDVRRMQAFLGMGPVPEVVGADAPKTADLGGAAGAVDARGGSAKPWGAPGREPRQAGQEPRNYEKVVRDVDYNRRRVAELEGALRTAGILVSQSQAADPATTVVSGSTEQQQRQRNVVMVSPGLSPEGAAGLAPPGRKLLAPLAGLPEPAQAELSRMAGDLKRMQAFLGMGPGATGAQAAAADGAKAADGAAGAGEGRGGPTEQWGAPGREPRHPGQEPRTIGEMSRDIENNKRRIAGLEEALHAAGIAVPLSRGPGGEGYMAVAGSADSSAAQRQRNGIAVSPGLSPEGATGFTPPGQKLLAPLAGLPEPAQAELSRMADDLKRVQAFLGMGPAVAAAGAAAAGPDAPKAASGAAGDARSVAVEPWGAPGREPRQPGQEPRNIGEVVRDVDENKRRIVELEEAMRAAGVPVPPPRAAELPSTAVSGAAAEQQRPRNAVMVSHGLAPEGATGFAPPGRKLLAPLAGLPEPAQAELSRMADDLKRMQAFLGMGPGGPGAQATAADGSKVAAGAEGEDRGGPTEQWGASGREPRQPGQEPRSIGEIVKDLNDYKQRVGQLEEALRAAGIPMPEPQAAGVTSVAPSQDAAQRQRNGITVSPGLVPGPEAAAGFAPPKRTPGASDAMPESLPARVEALQDEVKRMKAFVGMLDAATAGAAAAAAAPKAAGMAVATEAGPWAGPGRDKSGAEAPADEVAKELDDVKKQLGELDRALRGAGMGYMLPKEGAALTLPVQQQPQREGADRQRGGVAVLDGGLQRPLDATGFPPMHKKDGLPPIQNPSFVDAKEYDKLKDDVDRMKAFMGMREAKPGPEAAAAAAGGAVGAAEAAGSEPWAAKSLKEEAEAAKKAADEVAGELERLRRKVADMEQALRMMDVPDRAQQDPSTTDVRGGADAGPGGGARNPIFVTPGVSADSQAKGFEAPGRKQTVEVPEGIADPVIIDGEDYRQLKKALEDLQTVVGTGPQADGARKGKTLKEDTEDIKKFVRAMGKDVGAMGNDMQTLKKHLDDVEAAMNRALANFATELAKMKAVREEEPDSPAQGRDKKLESAGDTMAETLNEMAALNAAQQQQLARVGDGSRAEDIEALNEAMRQSENQLARLLAFLKQDVMDRFAVHEKTLIRMAKQIDFIQRMLKGEFDEQREAARDSGSNLTVSAPNGAVMAPES